MTEWMLTPEAFDKFLRWLDPDRDKAGQKYEDIRRRLTRWFNYHGCSIPEELTDVTINRVIKIINTKAEGHTDEPIRLFFGVARKVYLEWVNQKQLDPKEFQPSQTHIDEQKLECLEACLEKLPQEERSLIIRYHKYKGREKIDCRQGLAAELGLTMNALRIRACRIGSVLRDCVTACIENKAA